MDGSEDTVNTNSEDTINTSSSDMSSNQHNLWITILSMMLGGILMALVGIATSYKKIQTGGGGAISLYGLAFVAAILTTAPGIALVIYHLKLKDSEEHKELLKDKKQNSIFLSLMILGVLGFFIVGLFATLGGACGRLGASKNIMDRHFGSDEDIDAIACPWGRFMMFVLGGVQAGLAMMMLIHFNRYKPM